MWDNELHVAKKLFQSALDYWHYLKPSLASFLYAPASLWIIPNRCSSPSLVTPSKKYFPFPEGLFPLFCMDFQDLSCCVKPSPQNRHFAAELEDLPCHGPLQSWDKRGKQNQGLEEQPFYSFCWCQQHSQSLQRKSGVLNTTVHLPTVTSLGVYHLGIIHFSNVLRKHF